MIIKAKPLQKAGRTTPPTGGKGAIEALQLAEESDIKKKMIYESQKKKLRGHTALFHGEVI